MRWLLAKAIAVSILASLTSGLANAAPPGRATADSECALDVLTAA
jgi:hypothetical protein